MNRRSYRSPGRRRMRRRAPGTGPAESTASSTPVLGNQALLHLARTQTLQTKLKINTPGDQYEREADRMADHVMQSAGTRPPEFSAPDGPPDIQRLCTDCQEEARRELDDEFVQREATESEEESEREEMPDEEEEPAQMKERPGSSTRFAPSLRGVREVGGGRPLSDSARSFFEPRLGAGLGDVRLHTGPSATSRANRMNAQAFTVGSEVVLGGYASEPRDPAGRWVLAHELTHVVQQGHAEPGAASAHGTVEAEADHSANHLANGYAYRPRNHAAGATPWTAPTATGPGAVEFAGDTVILTNFDIGGAGLKPEWEPALAALAFRLNIDPSKEAEITGHTDSSGAGSINEPLSLNRANTIQQALESRVLEPAVASPITLGFGSQFPIDTNATDAGRARNRRVEIRIVDRPLPVVERVDLLDPAASLTTVVGSVAPVPGSTHGVTVAQEAASDVRVRAILNPPLPPGDRRLLLLSWTGATQDPAAPEEATMTRAAGQHVGVARLANFFPPIRSSSAQFTAWSVSAAIAPSGVPAITTSNGTGFGAQATVNFTATINPPGIITDADRPDLSGANPTGVPDSGIHLCGSALAGGADHRWDITRRFRQRVLNPAGLVPPAPTPACFWRNQVAFTGNTAEGNDDTHTRDETNDPYVNGGVLTSLDTPGDFVSDAQGANLNTLEIRMHFQEFARLDLGGAWHAISPPQPWRFHLRAIRFPFFGWVNNSSTSALDNANF